MTDTAHPDYTVSARGMAFMAWEASLSEPLQGIKRTIAAAAWDAAWVAHARWSDSGKP